jgi:HEAT repeat protein
MGRKDWTDDILLSRLINNKSDKSRWDYISVLRQRPSEALFSKCAVLTKSEDPKIRNIGIDILAQMGLPPRPFLNQTLTLYFDLLHIENDSTILMSLLFAIGQNNDKLSKTQIEKLCSFSETNNKLVKEGLVAALGFINDLKVMEVLIKLSNDQSDHIRDWAIFYLAQGERNNKYIRDALWARVNDKHQDTRLEAIVGLAKRKEKRVNDIIKRELIDGEYGTLLFEAIIETGNQDFLPFLQQQLKLEKGNTSINPEWVKDLENCINSLNQVINGKDIKNNILQIEKKTDK